MAFRCEHCGSLEDGDAYSYASIRDSKVIKDSNGNIDFAGGIWGEICETCIDEHFGYCYLLDEWANKEEYEWGVDESGDDILIMAAEQLGYRYNDVDDYWMAPDEKGNKHPEVNSTSQGPDMEYPYIDFYWQLEKGKRHCVMMKEGGGEVSLSHSNEQSIFDAIENAGGDAGDPDVVNVYTRLHLIKIALLPPTYTLS